MEDSTKEERKILDVIYKIGFSNEQKAMFGKESMDNDGFYEYIKKKKLSKMQLSLFTKLKGKKIKKNLKSKLGLSKEGYAKKILELESYRVLVNVFGRMRVIPTPEIEIKELPGMKFSMGYSILSSNKRFMDSGAHKTILLVKLLSEEEDYEETKDFYKDLNIDTFIIWNHSVDKKTTKEILLTYKNL